MNFVVPDKLAPPIVPETTGALVVTTAKLPATIGQSTLATVRAHDDTFARLIAQRGAKPTPKSLIGRFFNTNISWLSVWPAGAALATSPIMLASASVGAMVMGGAAVTALTAAYFSGFDLKEERVSPLSLVTRGRALKAHQLDFLGDISRATPLERATIGLLAERWKLRFDTQQVAGEPAYVKLEALAAAGAAEPAEVREQANKLVTLHDVMRNPETGELWTYIDSVRARDIVGAFEKLPADERRALAPELLRQYFKSEVPRFRTDSNTTPRALYRALVAAQVEQAS